MRKAKKMKLESGPWLEQKEVEEPDLEPGLDQDEIGEIILDCAIKAVKSNQPLSDNLFKKAILILFVKMGDEMKKSRKKYNEIKVKQNSKDGSKSQTKIKQLKKKNSKECEKINVEENANYSFKDSDMRDLKKRILAQEVKNSEKTLVFRNLALHSKAKNYESPELTQELLKHLLKIAGLSLNSVVEAYRKNGKSSCPALIVTFRSTFDIGKLMSKISKIKKTKNLEYLMIDRYFPLHLKEDFQRAKEQAFHLRQQKNYKTKITISANGEIMLFAKTSLNTNFEKIMFNEKA